MDHDADNPLPTLAIDLSADEIKNRLLKLSKRGKLAGFDAQCPDGLLSIAAHGTPFDSKLILNHHDGEVSFELKLLAMMPRIFALILIVTIWPGLPLTDDFLASFTWYESFMANIGFKTWYWYLPMTVLPAPFALKGAIKKSKSSAKQSAIEAIEKISKALGAG